MSSVGRRYVKPPHLEAAEFLQEVTTEDGEQYLKPGGNRMDCDGFAGAFAASPFHADVKRVVESKVAVEEIWARVPFPPSSSLSRRYIALFFFGGWGCVF